jgi:glycosyltransferase involved in cell wall biosynthesis
MTVPVVSIIVPTYNRCHYLPGALGSLVTLETAGAFEYEIIVVDNGSDDDTRAVVSSIADECTVSVRYVLEEREGVARARNAGIRAAKGDWLAFFDDDQLAAPDWLSQFFTAVEVTRGECFGGAVRVDLPEEELSGIGAAARETYLRESPRRYGDLGIRRYPRNEYPGTGNLFLTRNVISRAGGFNESMVRGGEDFDLALRILRAGFDMWFVPGAVVRHKVSAGRLSPDFMRWDAYLGGILQASLDHTYRGGVSAVLLCLARLGKALAVALPQLLLARATGDSASATRHEMNIRRQLGYVRGLLMALFPRVFPEEELNRKHSFRRRREVEQGGHS